MAEGTPKPLFNFRGHKTGVTALINLNSTLISGDEEGTIVTWDVSTFRRVTTWPNVCNSKIQSLRMIKLKIDSVAKNILVTQSRDGVYLINCDTAQVATEPSTIDYFPTYDSLFSKGDAISIDETEALLAYPSYLESHMITVRYLGPDAKTLISGSANRYEADSKSSRSNVFDVVISRNEARDGYYNLFVAYEDGCIVVYSVNRDSTQTIPELNVTGLKIDIVQHFDFEISDFISAFDVKLISDKYVIVCGSPQKYITFCTCSRDGDKKIEKVALNKQGTSTITIRGDSKLVAIAGWDNAIRLYSMKTRKRLTTINNHIKQVQDILFTEKPTDNISTSSDGKYLMYCASLDGTISVFDLDAYFH